jgi:hypothetical protein
MTMKPAYLRIKMRANLLPSWLLCFWPGESMSREDELSVCTNWRTERNEKKMSQSMTMHPVMALMAS